MVKLIIILISLFLLSNISAGCNETQIDINSASLEELDNLSGIGPAYAQRIIEGRKFNSVNDLINVSGIGKITLDKIKEQGLACVNEENSEEQKDDIKKEDSSEKTKEKKPDEIVEKEIETSIKKVEIKNLSPISLNAKSIKSETDTESLKRNLSFYGVIAMGLIFGSLFFIKNRKRKNEFN